MLYYKRIDISKGIASIGFLIVASNFKTLCNGCHDLSRLCVNISDITIITVKNVDYRCITHNISKYEAIYLFESVVLEN